MSASDGKRVLKAEALRGLGSRIVFDFEDLQQRSDAYLEKVRTQARQVVEETTRDAERIRREAREQGRREGFADGLRDAQAEIEKRSIEQAGAMSAEQIRTLLPAVREAAAALERERDRWLSEWERSAVELSLAIAERIVRREFAANPDRVRDVVAAVLELVARSSRIELRMHPGDVERLGRNCDELVAGLAACAKAEVVADDSISPGGCVVRTDHGEIDARIETQLDRIASELFPGQESEVRGQRSEVRGQESEVRSQSSGPG